MTDVVEHDWSLARLVYLIAEHRVKVPRELVPFLPWGTWLAQLHEGISAGDAMVEQAAALYQQGSSLGAGSSHEAFKLITRVVDEKLTTSAHVDTMTRVKAYDSLRLLTNGHDMLEQGNMSLADPLPDEAGIPKWDSGFLPLDQALGGLYQGLLVLMAKPGVGKTSVMLTLMEEIVKSGAASEVLFVENEIPLRMMRMRIKQMQKRGTRFRVKDRLICGSWSPSNLLAYVKENPNPDRVVFFDSPDVVTGSASEERRFQLEEAYQELIRVKMLSQLVVTSSQPRRKDAVLRLESPAEAWQKAWYADMICGISASGPGTLKLTVLKNRFGPAEDRVASWRYDYADLTWSHAPTEASDEDW